MELLYLNPAKPLISANSWICRRKCFAPVHLQYDT